MKYLNVMVDFISKNKKLLIIVLVCVLVYIIYNTFNVKYNKEIITLKEQIIQKNKQVEEILIEKQKLQDSSIFYEKAALKDDQKLIEIKQQVITLQKEKKAVLNTLNNLSKEVIDSFFHKRYIETKKVGTNISLDKNVGNEIVKELTEKDFLMIEIDLSNNKNGILTNQVYTLKTSLNFSKQALMKADTVTNIKTQQLQISQNINQLLEKNLKKAKRKAFWANIKGTAVGVIAVIIVNSLTH